MNAEAGGHSLWLDAGYCVLFSGLDEESKIPGGAAANRCLNGRPSCKRGQVVSLSWVLIPAAPS